LVWKYENAMLGMRVLNRLNLLGREWLAEVESGDFSPEKHANLL
jgi:hypothetical protein